MIVFLMSLISCAENFIPKGPLHHRYFVMRHGESVPNVEGRLCSSMGCGTDLKSGITEKGKGQVKEAIQEWLSKNKERKIVIVTSPFSRTLGTTEIIEAELKKAGATVVIQKDKRLIERYFGMYEGNPYSDELWKKVSKSDSSNPKKAPFQIEPLAKVESRMTKVVQALEKNNPQNQIYFLISHGDPLAVIQSTFEGKPLNQYHLIPRFKNAEIRELKR